jgi:hypothetical protein
MAVVPPVPGRSSAHCSGVGRVERSHTRSDPGFQDSWYPLADSRNAGICWRPHHARRNASTASTRPTSRPSEPWRALLSSDGTGWPRGPSRRAPSRRASLLRSFPMVTVVGYCCPPKEQQYPSWMGMLVTKAPRTGVEVLVAADVCFRSSRMCTHARRYQVLPPPAVNTSWPTTPRRPASSMP